MNCDTPGFAVSYGCSAYPLQMKAVHYTVHLSGFRVIKLVVPIVLCNTHLYTWVYILVLANNASKSNLGCIHT